MAQIEMLFVGWNADGNEASFNDLESAEAFAKDFGGDIERIGVAFRVTGSKSRDDVQALYASKAAKDVTPQPVPKDTK